MITEKLLFGWNKVLRVFLHLLYWYLCMEVFFGATSPGNEDSLYSYLPKLLIKFSPIVVFTYINHAFLIPKYLKTKRYLVYILLTAISLAVFSILIVFLKLNVISEPLDRSYRIELMFAISWVLIFSGFAFVLKILREWLVSLEMNLKLKEVQKQKVEAELSALKAQVNPHFLFNTLNNIYALCLDKSDKTADLRLQLADLMSYTLYGCADEQVLVSKEIKFIKNYIDLERIRLNDKVIINVDIRGQYTDVRIAPLLFIPFIENAFKHRVNQRPLNPYISILFDFSHANQIHFTIENNKPKIIETIEKTGGIGITNVTKRLDLLYPNRYSLDIVNLIDIYKVNLNIQVR